MLTISVLESFILQSAEFNAGDYEQKSSQDQSEEPLYGHWTTPKIFKYYRTDYKKSLSCSQFWFLSRFVRLVPAGWFGSFPVYNLLHSIQNFHFQGCGWKTLATKLWAWFFSNSVFCLYFHNYPSNQPFISRGPYIPITRIQKIDCSLIFNVW